MSISASVDNLSSDNQSCDGGSMCLELALEGERLCKAGDCRAGVAFFQAAIQAGTDDLRTLSAIYSQIGNAYFYLGDFSKAMQYHKHDLTLARTMGDKLGEAKSSGNLGNTLKVMGKFNEAITCCKRHLELSRELGDKLSEGRALYNLGNVYHAQGKQLGRVGQNDPGQFPQEVRDCLKQAVSYYEQNFALMRNLEDRQACGRACGNLGNTCYLLGDFVQAIKYHTERLNIAQEFGDKAAERRANSNLGNSHIFLGQFENAAEHYKRTLHLAQELGDAAVEAQACYSLGNTYTLLRKYELAEQYHSRHLEAARKLQDKVGEGRACWSLGNAHAALGNHEKAFYYANKHLAISTELGDALGVATAKLNVSDLRKVLGLPPGSDGDSPITGQDSLTKKTPQTPFNALRVRRQSMEQLSLIQITPDKQAEEKKSDKDGRRLQKAEAEDNPADSFFDLLSRCQSERMDDQRATLQTKANKPMMVGSEKGKLHRSASQGHKQDVSTSEAMLELIQDMQSERMDGQRAALQPQDNKTTASSPHLPGLRTAKSMEQDHVNTDDDFLDMLARVQGTRLEDQRSELPTVPAARAPRAVTVPDEDFFSLVMRVQGGRMEDQRASVPKANPAKK